MQSAQVSEQLRLFDYGSIDMQALRKKRSDLKEALRATQTVRGYAADWRVFSRWCEEAGRIPSPCDPETLSLYVTWQLSTGRRTATAKRHIAAVLDVHRRAGLTAPDAAEARSVIVGFRRERGERPQGKAALSPDDLARASRKCDTSTNLGLRDRALLILGFATSFRRSDLVRLNLSDIVFSEQGIIIVQRRSKTDQQGKGRIMGIWPGRRASTDPVRTLKAWIRKRGTWEGPLFCRVQTGDTIIRAGITGDAVNDLVKRAVARAGLDPARYGGHSLRAGAITASAELGRSDQEIMGLSGHASAKVMRSYVRSGRLFAGRNPLAGAL
jgi:integrase